MARVLADRGAVRRLAEVALYAALAVALTWPLAGDLGGHLPLGTEQVATVPLFNLWTLWWNGEWFAGAAGSYWDAPIFHPATGVFALSEPQPLLGGLATFIRAAGFGIAGAYNAVLLLALIVNGIAVAALVRAVVSPAVAVAAGAGAVALPFVHQELGVLQLVPIAGAAATLASAARFGRAPGPRSGLLLGLSFAATYLMCTTYALMLAVAGTGPALLLIGPVLRRWRAWFGLAVAVIAAAVPIAPVARAQLGAAAEHELSRSHATVRRNSARLGHYRQSAWSQLVPVPGIGAAKQAGGRGFWPGTVAVALALAGVVVGLRRAPRFTAAYIVLAGLAVLLSLGPPADEGQPSLYGLVAAVVPGFAQLRSPFRFAMLFQLATVVLAALGLDALGGRGRRGRAGLVLVTGATALVVFGVRPGHQPLQPLPPLDHAAWVGMIEATTSADDVIAFLPLPEAGKVEHYLVTTQWMYWQMRHRRRMVNGYSGYFPAPFVELRDASRNFPDGSSLAGLAVRGVSHCVVLRSFRTRAEIAQALRPRTPRQLLTGGPTLRWVAGDDLAGLDIYELSERPPASRAEGGSSARNIPRPSGR